MVIITRRLEITSYGCQGIVASHNKEIPFTLDLERIFSLKLLIIVNESRIKKMESTWRK